MKKVEWGLERIVLQFVVEGTLLGETICKPTLPLAVGLMLAVSKRCHAEIECTLESEAFQERNPKKSHVI